ncbi:DNA primase/helicase [Salmonella phage PST-D24]|uniref:DnaB-like replicative helicase n=1 Tax=Salmonella phage pertopsoe TaxID=2713310 RepID=A0A6G8RPQ0_9CAUD|nr:DNA primase-helicase subunit [Salmonella phage pertopsoe]QIO03332.1 DNA primase-helicase subunit [Salmonella phage pertopsoe]WBF04231.1 DNA primase/helicase [Salmonella phage PST-D24]
MLLESVVLSQLIYNEEYQRKIQPYLKADYFDNEGEKIIFGLIDHYTCEYNARPSVEALSIMLEKTSLNEHVFEQAISALENINDNTFHQEWLVKETESWARQKAVHNAIRQAVNIYGDEKRKDEMNNIPTLLQEALAIQFDSYLGHIYWEMAEQQYDHMNSNEAKIPFAVEIFNKATRGGVGKKTLNIVTGAINAGKTTTLIDLAAGYAEQGLNVFVFTLEVAENVWRHRLDARMMRRDFESLEKLSRHEYIATIQKLRTRQDGSMKGDIVIKEYPSGAGHTGLYRRDILDYATATGITPDVIIIDYLGESASSRLPAHLMQNTNVYYTSVAREFRALGFEFDCPVWTGMQFNREKQSATDGDISDLADAIGIPKVADFIMAFYAPDELAAVKKARASILKNRYANKQKLKSFLFGMDQDKQILFDLDWNEVKRDLTDEEARYVENVHIKHDLNKTGDSNDVKKAETVNSWNFG